MATPTDAQILQALHAAYGRPVSAPLILVGSGLSGPVGVPIAVSDTADAIAMYGTRRIESARLVYGDTTVTLTGTPADATVTVRSVDPETQKLVYDTLQDLSWTGAVGTFLPLKHIPEETDRLFVFDYAVDRPASDVVASLAAAGGGPATLLQATGAHATVCLPTDGIAFTATVTSGSTTVVATSSISDVEVGMIFHLAGRMETSRIIAINDSTITLESSVQCSTGTASCYAGGAIFLVTMRSGCRAEGYDVAVALLPTGDWLLDIGRPAWEPTTTMVLRQGATLSALVDQINWRAAARQLPVCAVGVFAHLGHTPTIGSIALDGADDTVPATAEDWYTALDAALANCPLDTVRVLYLPLEAT